MIPKQKSFLLKKCLLNNHSYSRQKQNCLTHWTNPDDLYPSVSQDNLNFLSKTSEEWQITLLLFFVCVFVLGGQLSLHLPPIKILWNFITSLMGLAIPWCDDAGIWHSFVTAPQTGPNQWAELSLRFCLQTNPCSAFQFTN